MDLLKAIGRPCRIEKNKTTIDIEANSEGSGMSAAGLAASAASFFPPALIQNLLVAPAIGVHSANASAPTAVSPQRPSERMPDLPMGIAGPGNFSARKQNKISRKWQI